jgi:hypothetical protein
MYPGLSEVDCQVAGFRHRQLVADGHFQQFVASVLPVSAGSRVVPISLRQPLGALLVRVGEHLQSVEAVRKAGIGLATTRERGVIA